MKVIIMIVALSTFMPSKQKIALTGISLKQTSYYWFDASGNYLHQNSLGTEQQNTGYNTSSNVPSTLRERGYAPSNCIVNPPNPPVPNDPSAPDQILYSHP